MSIAAILLAAGESTRMGRLKALLPWAGTTLIDWQVRQLQAAGAGDIVVVLGHAAETLRAAVPAEARIVVNEGYREGRASSLRAGAGAINAAEAVLVLSVDQPRPAWVSRLLIERWRATRATVVSPRFPGGYGHPVLLDGALLPELAAVTEADLGLRAVVQRHIGQAETVVIENAAIDVDLNTPADYESALSSLESEVWNEAETPGRD